MSQSRISSCVGCRLRRRKCDQKRPICTACDELKIPVELCIYRKMSLISKDSKATLNKLKDTNYELKLQLDKYRAKFLDNYRVVNKPHIPLEKHSLFRTVRESSTSLSHFGSTSWAALMDTEPVLKEIVTQLQYLMIHEKHQYDTRMRTDHELYHSISVMKGRSLLSQIGLEREDHLDFIKVVLQKVEDILPAGDSIVHFLNMFKDYNSMKALGTFLVDFDSLNQAVLGFLMADRHSGKTRLNINLPHDLDKMPYVLLFLASLSLMIFVKNRSVTSNNQEKKDINCLAFLKYVDSLFTLLHNYLADKGALRLLYTVETFQALFISGIFQRYVPHGRKIDDLDGAKAAVFIRKIVSLGKLLNLNKNIDVYYAHKTPQVRRSLKSLWYSVAAYDSLEALEIGLTPKIKEPFVRYDDFASQFTEISIVMNEVLKLYYQIELMEDTDKFINIIENDIIRKLKDLLRTSFAALEDDIEVFINYDFQDRSLNQDFFTRGQSFASRCWVYSTIQTFYHICYQRLRILNEKSPRFEKMKLLTWKYTLLVPLVMKELFKGYSRLVRHEHSESFYPVASLLMSVFPYILLAQRRIAVFACARFMEVFEFDQVSSTGKIFFYQSDNRENEIYEMLSQNGLYQKKTNLKHYSDLDIDDNLSELTLKLDELNDSKYIIVILAKTMQTSIHSLFNDHYNFNFVTYNFIFFFILKMSKFFLNQAFPMTYDSSKLNNISSSRTNTEFDFNELFENKKSQKFDFNDFFIKSYYSNLNHVQKNDILEAFFSNMNMP